MEIFNKIRQYLKDNLHIYVCICTFAIVTTAICTFVYLSIISIGNSNVESKYNQDTICVILKSEIEEISVNTFPVSKDSVYVAPTSNKLIIHEKAK